MPTFRTCTVVREAFEGLSLSLSARHTLVAGSPSEIVINVKGRVPEDVDVVLESNLFFTLSGLLESSKVPGCDVQQSAIAYHTVHYFRANSSQLGLSSVSNIFIDDDGTPKFCVTSSRPPLRHTSTTVARLVTVDLIYACKPVAENDDSTSTEGINLFASHVYLPMEAILDRMVEKFACFHLVRRYPLIFGPWRGRLDLEVTFFLPVSRSIASMAERSPNARFRKRLQRLLKILRKQFTIASFQSTNVLQQHLKVIKLDDADGIQDANQARDSDVDLICHSLQRLYIQCVRPVRYKGCRSRSTLSTREIEDEQYFDFSQDTAIDHASSSDPLTDDIISGSHLSQDTEVIDNEEFEMDLDGDGDILSDEACWILDCLDTATGGEKIQSQQYVIASLHEDYRSPVLLGNTHSTSASQSSTESDDSIDTLDAVEYDIDTSTTNFDVIRPPNLFESFFDVTGNDMLFSFTLGNHNDHEKVSNTLDGTGILDSNCHMADSPQISPIDDMDTLLTEEIFTAPVSTASSATAMATDLDKLEFQQDCQKHQSLLGNDTNYPTCPRVTNTAFIDMDGDGDQQGPSGVQLSGLLNRCTSTQCFPKSFSQTSQGASGLPECQSDGSACPVFPVCFPTRIDTHGSNEAITNSRLSTGASVAESNAGRKEQALLLDEFDEEGDILIID
ncbi:hypothetical protein AcW1_007712 [Taiwanofungus camphoratus]|nr:hypothetical protein AcW2_007227 [Antrodia cinnamomea]KAI0953516.1 hypothetical protein AcW1_007712 [Antrodia cinnamomea]